ncbi:MAG: hypothetical protein R2722_09545 [Tessaracoccus sp.]
MITVTEAVGRWWSWSSRREASLMGDVVVVPCVTPDWMSPEVQGKHNPHDEGSMTGFKFTSIKDGTMAEFFHVNHARANLVKRPRASPPRPR